MLREGCCVGCRGWGVGEGSGERRNNLSDGGVRTAGARVSPTRLHVFRVIQLKRSLKSKNNTFENFWKIVILNFLVILFF